MGGAHSPPRRGGEARRLIEAGAPGAKREPGRAKPQLMVSSAETFRRSDHPVCGSSVASRLLTDAASTPPLRGGECFQLRMVGPNPAEPPFYIPETNHSGVHHPTLQDRAGAEILFFIWPRQFFIYS